MSEIETVKFTPAPPLSSGLAAASKYYTCPVLSATMTRSDGQRIIFVHGVYEAKTKGDQSYLDAEIEAGHPFLKNASDEDVAQYKRMTDFKGTIREEVLAELTEVELEKIKEDARNKFDLSDEAKIGGVDLASKLATMAGNLRSGSATVKLGGITNTKDIGGLLPNSGI